MNVPANQPWPRFSRRRAFWLLVGCLFATAFVLVRSRQKIDAIVLPEFPGSTMVLRDGRFYRNGESSPFTGFVVERLGVNVLKSRSQIGNGLLNGASEGWHTNGVLQVREYFTNGVSHGLREKWHANGTKMSQVLIVGGKLHGLFQRW